MPNPERTNGIGQSLPTPFHNWPKEHNVSGTHSNIIAREADVTIGGKYNDHVIKNGSFENATGGIPDDWTHKP